MAEGRNGSGLNCDLCGQEVAFFGDWGIGQVWGGTWGFAIVCAICHGTD